MTTTATQFARHALASARTRAADDAAQVADLHAQIAQAMIHLQAAEARAERSAESLAALTAMADSLDYI